MSAAWWALGIFAMQAAFCTGYAASKKTEDEAMALAISMTIFSLLCMLGFGIALIKYYQVIGP